MVAKLIKGLRLLRRELVGSYQMEFAWYPGVLPWSVRVYDRLLRRATHFPLPARKKLIRMRFRNMASPFYMRLGSSDLQLHQTIRFRGEYRPVTEHKIDTDFRQVVDLGANAGYTIRLWRDLFPNARIIGVEPDPGNMEVCRLNADSLPGPKVNLIQACVDGHSGTVWLDRSDSEHRFHIGEGPNPTAVEVQALTVPEILEKAGADPVVDLLKCDIQGAERAVFAECRSWVSRVKNMIIEVHPPYTGDDLIADLRRNGWQWSECQQHKTDNLWVLFFWA